MTVGKTEKYKKEPIEEQCFDDEIDLRDYIRVILKRKKIILGIFFVAVIVTTVVSFLMPKIYEVSTVIVPGTLGVTNSGAKLYLDSPTNIKAIIESGAFNSKIITALNLNPRGKLEFNVSQPKKSDLIKISTEQPEDKRDTGLKILNQLFSNLSDLYKNIIELKKNNLEKQIVSISNNIETKNDMIKLHKEKLKLLEKRELQFIDEIKQTKINSEKLRAEREASMNKKVTIDNISVLLYTNTIQQNIAYSNQLQNQLANLRFDKENIKTEIKNLEGEINKLKIEIDKLNLAKDSIHNIELIQEPQVSPYPIKPRKRLMVSLSGVLGLMLGIFVAFFIEYWQKEQ